MMWLQLEKLLQTASFSVSTDRIKYTPYNEESSIKGESYDK